MMQIVDDAGNPIRGLLRDANGMIVVNDSVQFTKYKILKERDESQRSTISEMTKRLDELSKMVLMLVEDKNK